MYLMEINQPRPQRQQMLKNRDYIYRPFCKHGQIVLGKSILFK